MRVTLSRIFKTASMAAVFLIAMAVSAFANQPEPWQMNFQPAATPVMEMTTGFHNLLLILITVITLFVFESLPSFILS